MTITSGFYPVIETVETFAMTADGACGKVIITWKNVTPATLTF